MSGVIGRFSSSLQTKLQSFMQELLLDQTSAGNCDMCFDSEHTSHDYFLKSTAPKVAYTGFNVHIINDKVVDRSCFILDCLVNDLK